MTNLLLTVRQYTTLGYRELRHLSLLSSKYVSVDFLEKVKRHLPSFDKRFWTGLNSE